MSKPNAYVVEVPDEIIALVKYYGLNPDNIKHAETNIHLSNTVNPQEALHDTITVTITIMRANKSLLVPSED
jgi:hypothetical protein